MSGPVTGLPDGNRPAFDRAAEVLAAAGLRPMLPHWFVPAGADWGAAMRRCIETLVKCDALLLLPGWRGSRGASLEAEIAERVGIPRYETEGI